jgi:hypothetical protein
MHIGTFLICSGITIVLMVLFVFINFPYYRMTYGERAHSIVLRTILLNATAILIAWGPMVYFWPTFSLKYMLPFACVLGALGCVGSRFIYHEIVPEELAKKMIEIVERQEKG